MCLFAATMAFAPARCAVSVPLEDTPIVPSCFMWSAMKHNYGNAAGKVCPFNLEHEVSHDDDGTATINANKCDFIVCMRSVTF